MRLECEWRHARKRWSWEFGRFWKRISWELTLDDVGRKLGCLPQWQTVEVGIRPRCWEVELRPWCWEVGVRPSSWDFEVGPWKTIVEFLPLGHRVGFRPLKDVLSIVWLRKTFKNCVSLLVSKNRSQKLINGSYLNNGVTCVLYFPVFAFVYVQLLLISLWFWLYNTELYNTWKNTEVWLCYIARYEYVK